MTTVNRAFVPLLALAALLGRADIFLAQEPGSDLKRIAFSGARPMMVPRTYIGTHNDGEIRTICIEAKPVHDEHGSLVVHGGVGQKVIHVIGTNQTQGDTRYFSAGYPLKSGEIIPVAGFLYRVKECRDLHASLEWIPHKDLPEGLAATMPDSLIAPLFRFGIGLVTIDRSGGSMKVTEITTPKDAKLKTKAKIVFLHKGGPFTAEIQQGDFVLLTKDAFKVRNIIPADPKMKTAGWVEFEPNFIPEADLIRNKTPYVRPMPKSEKNE